MAEKVRAHLLAEADEGSLARPLPAPQVLVLEPVVQVGQQGGRDIERLPPHHRHQVGRGEVVGPPVVQVEVVLPRHPSRGARVPDGGERHLHLGGPAGHDLDRSRDLGGREPLHGRHGGAAGRHPVLRDPRRVGVYPPALAVEPGPGAGRDGRVAGGVHHVQAGGRGRASLLEGGAHPQRARLDPPVPGAHHDLLGGPARGGHPVQPHRSVAVPAREVHPLPAGPAPRGGERRAAPRVRWPDQEDRPRRVVHVQQPQLPAHLGGPVHRDRRPVGAERRARHGGDAAPKQRARPGARRRPGVVEVPNQHPVAAAAALGKVHQGARARLRLQLDPSDLGDPGLLPARRVERPQVDGAGRSGREVEPGAVVREGGVELDRRRVLAQQLRARFGVRHHDPGVARVVAHERDAGPVRRPGRARVHLRARGQPAGAAVHQVHHPDPAMRREGQPGPVRRSRRIDGAVGEGGHLVAFQVDLVPVALHPGVPVGPLGGSQRWRQRQNQKDPGQSASSAKDATSPSCASTHAPASEVREQIPIHAGQAGRGYRGES